MLLFLLRSFVVLLLYLRSSTDLFLLSAELNLRDDVGDALDEVGELPFGVEQRSSKRTRDDADRFRTAEAVLSDDVVTVEEEEEELELLLVGHG